MHSLWSKTSETENYASLKGDTKTDVLIIGGGMAGVLCAYFLHNAGIPYILAEGYEIGSDITKNTTAKITSQHGLLYHQLLKGAGVEKTRMYLGANQKAIEIFQRLCAKIDCDFEQKDAYVYSLSDRRIIEQELSALDQIGFCADFIDRIPLPFDMAGAVRFPQQAQFHPLKFLAGIAKSLNVYEHTFIDGLDKNTAFTKHGKIEAKQIIVATHFPFINRHGGYFLKMYQHRSYAIALEGAQDVDGMYLEETKDGMSFRNYGNLLIVSGGDHKTGKKGGNWKVLREFAAKAYPNSQERYAWATQDCMTLDGIPYIGRYGRHTSGLYVATGFNKWGMTTAMVAAIILTDLVQGRKNEFAEVFLPQRSMLKPQLLLNGLSAVGNLLMPSFKRCPHLGCALKWNPAEHSWDCPCHGSRFDSDGALIDNPATGGINI